VGATNGFSTAARELQFLKPPGECTQIFRRMGKKIVAEAFCKRLNETVLNVEINLASRSFYIISAF
jgi:hypothetical protein